MNNFDDVFGALSHNECTLPSLLSMADSHGLSGDEFCNRFSLNVARRYQNGNATFDGCSCVMNALFGIACAPTSPMFEQIGSEVWFAVYQAFDEGEYQHPGDDAIAMAEVKYTQPLIASILARGG